MRAETLAPYRIVLESVFRAIDPAVMEASWNTFVQFHGAAGDSDDLFYDFLGHLIDEDAKLPWRRGVVIHLDWKSDHGLVLHSVNYLSNSYGIESDFDWPFDDLTTVDPERSFYVADLWLRDRGHALLNAATDGDHYVAIIVPESDVPVLLAAGRAIATPGSDGRDAIHEIPSEWNRERTKSPGRLRLANRFSKVRGKDPSRVRPAKVHPENTRVATTPMRDTIADREHFVERIATLEELVDVWLTGVADGTKTERQPGSIRRRMWRKRIEILESRYSVGAPVEDLREPFVQIVAALPDLARFGDWGTFEADSIVTLSAWSVLLDDRSSAETLASVLVRNGPFEARAETLLTYFGMAPPGDSEWNPLIGNGWMAKARTALQASDAERASAILYKFVNKEWFNDRYNSGFLIHTHTGEKIGHVGYWCYEGAAYAKLAGIDDSELQGHKFYPWDLAHWP